MEEAPENGKESSHSAHANGMNGWMDKDAICSLITVKIELSNAIQASFRKKINTMHIPQCHS